MKRDSSAAEGAMYCRNPSGVAGARSSSVGVLVARGALWSLLALSAAKALSFGANLFLARLLNPADFGLYSFALILIGAFVLLQDLGVPAAIVYGSRDIKAVAGTALTINLVAAVLLLSATFVFSPFLATVSRYEEIGPIAMVLAVALVVQALGSVQRAYLVKELAFRRNFLPDVIPVAASGVTAVGLAVLGYGVWSLVLGYLIRVAAATGLLWFLSSVRVRPELNLRIARELLLYGKHVSLATIIGFAGMNVDYLVIGYLRGPSDLGLYTMAFTIGNLPYLIVGETVSKAMFPVLSRIRDDRELFSNSFLQAFSVVCLLSVPLAIMLILNSELLIHTVLSEKWVGAVGPLRVLAIFGVFHCVGAMFSAAYKALGRPDFTWKYNALKLLMLTPLTIYGAQLGISEVAWVHVITAACLLPVNALMFTRAAHLSSALLWRPVFVQLVGVAVATLTVLAAGRLLNEVGATSTSWLSIVGTTMFALIGYVLAIHIQDPSAGSRIARFLADWRRGRAERVSAPATIPGGGR